MIRGLLVPVLAASIGALGHAQAPSSPKQPPDGQQPIFRSGVTVVTTDVIVRDAAGVFMADLIPEDFIIYEDDVLQEVSSLIRVHGGSVFDLLVESDLPQQEGIVLPRVRMVDDTAGRIFVLFVDDLHLTARLTPTVRQLFDTIAETLVHEGDLFGIISTGRSNLAIDLTYDRSLLYAAADRIVGGGLDPGDFIRMQQQERSLSEIRWRTHLAFKTARETLKNLEQITNRRKVFIYISAGYDLNPFGAQYGFTGTVGDGLGGDPFDQLEQQGEVFAEADLLAEIAELTRAANRSSTTFHTLDPRGVMAGSDIAYNVPTMAWNSHVSRTQNSLRSLAALTGGIAIINRNSFAEGLAKIDAETSDYYVVGFNTNRPDVGESRTRQLRIEVNRQGAEVRFRESYTFDGVVSR